MAGPGAHGGEGPGGDPPQVIARRAQQRFAAKELIRRRRRILAPIGAPASEPLQQTTIPQVTMRGDPWKGWVRCASVTAGTFATSFNIGDTLDGVVLAAGDRFLLMHQADPKENGIYTPNASGPPTRAVDAASGEHLVHAVVGVMTGTDNGDKFFVCFTNSPIILGSTGLAWSKLSNFIGTVEGSNIVDDSIEIGKLFGSGLSAGAMLYCDGVDWLVLEPPGVASTLTHDGTTPAWTPL